MSMARIIDVQWSTLFKVFAPSRLEIVSSAVQVAVGDGLENTPTTSVVDDLGNTHSPYVGWFRFSGSNGIYTLSHMSCFGHEEYIVGLFCSDGNELFGHLDKVNVVSLKK